MTQIPLEVIESTLRIYKPNKRMLKSASIEYPIVRGIFLIGPCDYVQEGISVNHATDIEIQFCLNQLAYTGVAEAIRRQEIPELRGLDFSKLQTNNLFIIESKKRFRRPIRTYQEISGELKLKEWRDDGYMYRGWADFQFENRGCFGGLEFALVKSCPCLEPQL